MPLQDSTIGRRLFQVLPTTGGAKLSLVPDEVETLKRLERSTARPLSGDPRLGQVFTPPATATFLAELLQLPAGGVFEVLDPGAGEGALSEAVIRFAAARSPRLQLRIHALELDERLLPTLRRRLGEAADAARASGVDVAIRVHGQSFIEFATGLHSSRGGAQFDACIMNPPYMKVRSRSTERLACEAVGLSAGNAYTQFMGLACDLLRPGGQLSAIVPRSFANGPYHEPFRRYFLERMGIDFLHVYESRGSVFKDAAVLQENVIIKATRGAQAAQVRLSSSVGPDDIRSVRSVPAGEVVKPEDPHSFVRIPIDARDTQVAEQISSLPATLTDLNIQVSTGRVVDFRVREALRKEPEPASVPLIYPGHLRNGRIAWPQLDSKKPNALARASATDKLVLPNEPYVLVKRFSAKEERRRLVAAVSSARDVPGTEVAFENHLNVFHRKQRGLDELLALGLSAFINSTVLDLFFRTFSGHTQVNATDLRQLRYPSLDQLEAIGSRVGEEHWTAQDSLDTLVGDLVPGLQYEATANR